jgi:hypothetical protein
MDSPMNPPEDFSDESDYEPSDEEYGEYEETGHEETEHEETEHEERAVSNPSSSPSSSSSPNLGVNLDNRLTKFANDIESLSRSDFEVTDTEQVKILLERITAAVKNIELSI